MVGQKALQAIVTDEPPMSERVEQGKTASKGLCGVLCLTTETVRGSSYSFVRVGPRSLGGELPGQQRLCS